MTKPPDWNDAYVWPQPDTPEPDPDAEKFEVTGTQPVDGYAPGDQFDAVIDEPRRSILLEYGHLRLVLPETTEELREEAKELGLKGRSKMNKAELAGAVEEAKTTKEPDAT